MNTCCFSLSFGRPARTILALPCLLFLLCLSTVNAPAQALSDMPAVERVKAEIKGSDAADTLARQAAVFDGLVEYVKRIKNSRTVRGPFTPEEQKFSQDYSLASYQISQQYEKTHTPAETQAFGTLRNRYEMDGAFEHDWRTRLLGKQATATYNAALGSLAAGQQQHYQQEMGQTKQAMERQQTPGGSDPNDPTGVAIRRCLELGGSSLGCIGKGMNTGMLSLIGMGGMDTSKMLGPGPARIVLHGTYERPGEKTSLEFSISRVAIAGCGSLDASQTSPTYEVQKQPGTVRVVVNNSPRPFTLLIGPDGRMTGPGMVDVTGQTIVGWTTQTTQTYKNGVSVGAGVAAECGGFCRSTTQSPIYRPKTERCSIGTYNAPPPPPPHDPKADAMSNSPAGMILGLVTYTNGGAEAMDNADAPRGLRMNGLYSDGRMKLQFSPKAVMLDCGQAHVLVPYTVENTPERILVRVDNNGGPFTLAMEPDNALHGSGSTTVNGRLVSGMQGQNVSFRALSESCTVGTLRPSQDSGGTMQAAGGASPFSALAGGGGPTAYAASAPAGSIPSNASPSPGRPASPAASAAGMRVLISSTFPAGANPLAGQIVWLMRDRMDAVLRSLGAPIPANATPAQAWLAFAKWCQSRDCKSMQESLGRLRLAQTTLDASGRATISSQSAAAGPYYFFALVASPAGALLWDVPANLSAGDNTVTFTPATAENIRNLTQPR